MDIVEVEVYADANQFAGTLGPSPYCINFDVEGSNIDSVIVRTPNGADLSLVATDDGWNYYQCGFSTMCEISSDPSIGFGDFDFTFTAQDASVETATVGYNPGCTDPHTGYGDVTFPIHGQTDVVLDPTLIWMCADGPCGNFAWYMELFPAVGQGASYEADILDPGASEWTPGLLTGSTLYRFYLSAGTSLEGSPQALMTTPGNDAFLYFAGFETINEIEFSTAAANAGAVPPTMVLQRISPFEVALSWSFATCAGETNYGIYAGFLGDWTSHVAVDCEDDGGDLTEVFTSPPEVSLYFLVVPWNDDGEGSYGLDSSSAERPPSAGATCQPIQLPGCS